MRSGTDPRAAKPPRRLPRPGQGVEEAEPDGAGEEAGRIGATPLILLLLALGGTLALPIGFDRMSRRDGYESDQFLR